MTDAHELYPSGELLAHSHCLTGSGTLMAILMASNLLIFLSWCSIPIAIAHLVRSRIDLPYKRMLWIFSAFILVCGLTHLMDVVVLWYPQYVLDAVVKGVSAAVSVLSAILFWILLPKALKLPGTDQLNEAQQLARMGSWDLDLIHNQLTWSDQAFQLFEIDPKRFEATYEAFLATVHPEDRDKVDQAYRQSLIDRSTYEITHRLLMPDGRIKWVTERGKSYFDAAGKPLRSIGTVQDITEQKSAEMAVREAHTLLQTIIDTLPVRIFWKDRALRFLGCNLAVVRDAGLEHPDQLIGKDDTQMVWSAQAARYRADDCRVIDTGVPMRSIVEPQTTPDGGTIWLSTSKVPLQNTRGETIGVLGVYEDITQQVHDREELLQSREQLRDLAAHQETMLEEERKRIARDIHDELGQQLSTLRLDVGLLRSQYAQDGELVRRAQQMNALIDNAIDCARQIAGNLRPASLDLGIVAAIESLADEFRAHSAIECNVHVDEPGIELPDGSAITVFRIVQESLTNIAHHSGADSVSIDMSIEGSDFLLYIRDNGRGFDLEEPPRAGHGLIGMRERVRALGGSLAIDSRPGKGTRLSLRLKAHP